MKALTICQPYAELIARGEKIIENRTWPTSYRGPIAIHAGKSRSWLNADDLKQYPSMVFGAVIATARLIDCVRYEHLGAHLINDKHANGPWCWLLADVIRVDPPQTINGALGLWTYNWPLTELAKKPRGNRH